MKKFISSLALISALVPKTVLAHCPLCTAGAGALAVAAAYFGISSMIVGVFVGAFALALGMWLAGRIKKSYFPRQYWIISLLIFLGTILPIMPLVQDYAPLYVPFWGEFGKTFAVNLFLSGLPLGVLALMLAPYLSRRITSMRQGSTLPFQGVVITFMLLIVVSLIIQFV